MDACGGGPPAGEPGVKEGEPRPWAGAGEPLRFPGGSEARTPSGGRPGGQQPPRFWGLPIPTRREARREGDGPFLGHAYTGAAIKVSSGGAALAAFDRGGRGAQGGARPAARNAPGGRLSPARRRIAPAGRGTEARGSGRRRRRRGGGSAATGGQADRFSP